MTNKLLLAALLALSACTEVGPDYHLPTDAAINTAAAKGSFVSAAANSTSVAPVPDGWWKLYDDARLNQLESEALAANHELRIATANLARAQAVQREVEGAQDIKGSADFAAERAQLSGQSYLLPVQLPTEYLGSGGVSISYQLDLFGRLKRAAEAASADREASEAGVELAQITIAAEVAHAYVEACSAGRELQTTGQFVALQQRAQDVTAQLIASGRLASSELPRSQAQVEQARATLPQYQARQKIALYRLAVLTGHPPAEYPRDIANCQQPPRLSQPIPVGDGAALLRRRPDIRQAERTLAGATARIGVATAALYPDIRLGASGGSIGTLTSLAEPSAPFWSAGALISWSLPDTSAHARIAEADATTAASLAHFDAVVLNALRETEQNLTNYARDLDRATELRAARDHLAEAAAQAQALYQAGRSPYLIGVSAKLSAAQAELALATAEDQIASDQITLFLSLGGGWHQAL